MHGHLVTVEVRVVGGTDEGVQLDGLAFDQHRLEGLDTEPVERRRTVQEHGVLADDLGENVPDLRRFALDHLFRRLDRRGEATRFQLAEDEGLEELQRHFLGQTALVQAQCRPHHDDRAPGVVDALAEQVLTEPALLALDHVGEGLQGPLVGAGDGSPAATVVEQRIHRFLQHALLVAHDDVGRVEVEETLQAVVAVDYAPIEIVQIGGCEATAVEGNEGTKIRRQHGQCIQHHPLRLVTGVGKRLHELEALRQLLDLRLGVRGRDLFAQRRDLTLDVQLLHEILDGLGTHLRRELVAEFLHGLVVLLVRQHLCMLERRHAGIGDDIGLEIQHALDVAQRHVEEQADARRQGLQEPDVSDGAGELDMPHALAANLRQRNFHAALLADHSAVLEPLVLSAEALVVLHGAEDLGAEKTIALGLEGPVVDRLGLFHFPEGPGTDHVR